MKVLHISTTDFGGAGNAAYRLHLGLRSLGINSKMLVLGRQKRGPDTFSFETANSIGQKIHNNIYDFFINKDFHPYKNIPANNVGLFTSDKSIYEISSHPLIQDAQIINLHLTATMLNHINFFSKAGKKRFIWTLHDMNPFTGGCHYSANCKRYKEGCGRCPQLNSKKENDLSRNILKRKLKAYGENISFVVSPTKWLAGCAQESMLFKGKKVEVIPNGVPTDIFRKRDRHFTRDLLKLPQDKMLFLFGADKTKRKGQKKLAESIGILSKNIDMSKVGLITFGGFKDNFLKSRDISLYRLGHITDELLLSCVYSAADMLLFPSSQDNLPNILLEAGACSLPVIGFDAGGVGEFIEDGQNGFIVKAADLEGFAGKIKWVITNRQQLGIMAKKAGILAREKYSIYRQARQYVNVYQKMLMKGDK